MKPVFGILALLINLLGYVPYVQDIVKGRVKPQRITWGIWAALGSVVFANQVTNGGGWSVVFFGSTAFLTTLVFVLSLRRGTCGGSKTDRAMLLEAVALFVYWFLSRDSRTTTLIAVLIDAVGALPTIIKTFRKPKTETYPQWVMAGLGGLFALFAVAKADYILFVYPLYIIFVNATIIAAKYYAERSTVSVKTAA